MLGLLRLRIQDDGLCQRLLDGVLGGGAKHCWVERRKTRHGPERRRRVGRDVRKLSLHSGDSEREGGGEGEENANQVHTRPVTRDEIVGPRMSVSNEACSTAATRRIYTGVFVLDYSIKNTGF